MHIKTITYIVLIIIILINPSKSFQYASQGLYQWATRIVPTLFPFMMISSIMINSGSDIEIGKCLSKLLKKIFCYTHYGIYAIFIGFLCGFPMGAKIVCELYASNKLTKHEAESLLGFCNNIGPAYFLGIIIPILEQYNYNYKAPFIFGMYGIPAIYGILLSYLFNQKTPANTSVINPSNITITSLEPTISLQPQKTPSFSSILKKSCFENTQSIILLGGYITFTNAFRVFIDYLPCTTNYKSLLSGIIEIVSGVQLLYQTSFQPEFKIFVIMTLLCFGGISCLLQTSCFLEKSNISIKHYLKHKLYITIISALYYLILLYLI